MPPKKKIIESLDEELLKHVATKYNMTLPQTSIKIDECIQRTAMIMKVSYSVVYNYIFTDLKSEFEQPPSVPDVVPASPQKAVGTAKAVESILIDEGICDQLDIDQCNSSSSCFYLEPYGCLSKKIEDADIINEDPDKYIESKLGKIADLERMVKIASFLYYNYEGGGIDDNSFDALEWHLKKKIKLKDRLYEKIGAEPVDKIKTRLKFEMPSLIKVKPGTSECNTFLSQFIGSAFVKPVPCAWSLKLDGVSGMLIYKNGILVEINTRGTGIVGGNVTYLKDYILTIPQRLKSSAYNDFVVRGEFILPTEKWNKKYKGSYANPRAFVSGKINAGFISPALHDIDFVAYEIMYESLVGDKSLLVETLETKRTVPQPSHATRILEVEGFKVVDDGVLHSPTVFEIMELYKEKRLKSEYRIDGLVLALDKLRKPAKRITPETMFIESPTHTVAFKMILDDQIRSTEIINVEWNISRYGRYVPVAIYKAVYIEGIRLARATAHNARHVQDWNMGKGTKVKVVRSGDVIPQIKDVEVDNKIKPIFPKIYDEGGYEWHWRGSDIFLDEIETNKEVLIKRVVHFFETINVPRIGQKTAEKFYEAGMSTPESVVKSSVENFMKIKGIGKKTAESYYHGIRKIMAVTPPDRFIVASTTFESGLGRKLLKQLFKVIPNILDMSQLQIETYFKAKKVTGFGPSRIKMVSEGIPKFREYLDSFAKDDVSKAVSYYVERMKELDKNGRNKLIEGKKFVTTNFMGSKDYELEDYISDNNGEFVSTVTSDVSAIICGTIMSITKKMKDASELNVPVLSLQEFCNRFNVPLKKFDNGDSDKNIEDD